MSEIGKKAAAEKAAQLIEDGMTVGLGTGSTANYFIDALITRCKQGLNIQALATSKASERRAALGGIPLVTFQDLTELDICVDGADEIDDEKNMIKGGGGALLREKIVATASKEMVVIVDEAKCVKALGNFPLPVEITPFGHEVTIKKIETLGLKGNLRNKDSVPYLTDNQNYILDIPSLSPILDPKNLQNKLLAIPGVVETGLFIGIAGRVLLGNKDGTVVIK